MSNNCIFQHRPFVLPPRGPVGRRIYQRSNSNSNNANSNNSNTYSSPSPSSNPPPLFSPLHPLLGGMHQHRVPLPPVPELERSDQVKRSFIVYKFGKSFDLCQFSGEL